MLNLRTTLLVIVPLLLISEGLLIYKKSIEGKSRNVTINKTTHVNDESKKTKVIDQSFTITPVSSFFKSYSDIIEQLKKWQNESPSVSELITYGKTSSGTECKYFRIGTKEKPKVLIHSGLYGDEEFSILATMNLIEKILKDYGKNDDITWIIENRDIYFVPVSSPDTYLKPDKIEGYNPHTCFPYPKRPNNSSPSPVKLLMGMMCNMKFKAVLNMHTPGESIYPPEICKKEDGDKICNLIDKMIGLNGYKTERVENSHGSGTDTDWFYSSGAASVQMMWGKKTRQFVDYSDVSPSVDRNLSAIILFIKEGTELELNPTPLRTIYYYEAD